MSITNPLTVSSLTLVELSTKEEALLNKLLVYLHGSAEQCEQGFELMSEALNSSAFQQFLLKIHPRLYTTLLLNDSDISYSCLTFLLLATDTKDFSSHLLKNQQDFATILSGLLSDADDTIVRASFHLCEKLLSYENPSYFIPLIPQLTRHAFPYDILHSTSLTIISRLLTSTTSALSFFKNSGVSVLAELLNGSVGNIADACNIFIQILTCNPDLSEHQNFNDSLTVFIIKENLPSLLLAGTSGDAAPECMKVLACYVNYTGTIPALAASTNLLVLVDALQLYEQNTTEVLTDALTVIKAIISFKHARSKFRAIGFSAALITLITHSDEIGVNNTVITCQIINDIADDEALLNELIIYQADEALSTLKLPATSELCDSARSKISHRVKPSRKSTQEEGDSIKSLEMAMSLSKAQGSISAPDSSKVLSPRSRERKSISRKKRNAMIMKGFDVNDLAEHFTDGPQQVMDTPRILKSPTLEDRSRGESIEKLYKKQQKNATSPDIKADLSKPSSNVIEIHKHETKQEAETTKPNDTKDKKETKDTEGTKEEKKSSRLSLQTLKLPSVEVISSEGNKEQLAFVSQLNAQSNNRKRCLEELLQGQKTFNSILIEVVGKVVPDLEKLTKKVTTAFPIFEILYELHKTFETQLETILKSDITEIDASIIFRDMLDNKKCMKAYEKYWRRVDVDNVRYLRDIPEVGKKMKELDKSGIVLEKIVLQPMDRFRRFASIIDILVKNTPDYCIEHENIVNVQTDIEYLIAYFDEKRQANMGSLKIRKYRQNVNGFNVDGEVLLDGEIYAKAGKKAELLTVVLVKQEKELIIIGVGKKKKQALVKWTFAIETSTVIVVKDMKLFITLSEKEKIKVKSGELQLQFRIQNELNQWVGIITKEKEISE
ncbi:DH domain-containing protein [Entamoeba marina]